MVHEQSSLQFWCVLNDNYTTMWSCGRLQMIHFFLQSKPSNQNNQVTLAHVFNYEVGLMPGRGPDAFRSLYHMVCCLVEHMGLNQLYVASSKI